MNDTKNKVDILHIKGFANEINLSERLDSREGREWGLHYFDFEQEETFEIERVFVRFYESNEICTLEEAHKGFQSTLMGLMSVTGQAYGYSEFSIEGYDIRECKIGEHCLQDIINSKGNKYLHILFAVINQ